MEEKNGFWQRVKSIIFWGEPTIDQKNFVRARAKLWIKWILIVLLTLVILYLILPDLYKPYSLVIIVGLLPFLVIQLWNLITGVECDGY